jgi:hypothetical protein
MVLAKEPLHVPAFEGRIQGKHEEIPMRSGLDANASHHLVFVGPRLIFQEQIMLEQSEVWEDGEIGFVEMDEGSYLENGVAIQMD